MSRYLIIITSLLMVIASVNATAKSPVLLKLTPAQLAASDIRFELISSKKSSQGMLFSGQIEAAPEAQWVVTAPLDGVVTRVLVSEGELVQRGQSLIEMVAPQAPALAAELTRTSSLAQLAVADFKRDKALHAEGIIPARRMQASDHKAREAQADHASIKQQLSLLGISPDQARRGKISVSAPAISRLIARRVALGARVSAGDALLQLIDPNQLMLMITVPLSVVSQFNVGQRLLLSDPQSVHKLSATAVIEQVGWGSLTGNQTQIRARLVDKDASLRPGQWLKASMQGDARDVVTSVSVPKLAILRDGQQSYVFVQRPAGVQAIAVECLDDGAEFSLVSGDVRAGDRVAVSGLIVMKSLLKNVL